MPQSSDRGEALANQEPILGLRPRRGWMVAWSILLLALVATLLVWGHIHDQITGRALERFSASAEEIGQCLRFRMHAFEQVVRGGQGLFRASNRVEHDAWHTYVQSQRLDEYFGGVLSVGFAPWVERQNLDRLYRSVARDFIGEFRLRPEGDRPHYVPVFYVEPNHQQPEPGFDLLSDPVRRTAMLRARDTGEVTLSARVDMPGTPDRNTVVLYAPVYRGEPQTPEGRTRRLMGFVFAPLLVGRFMDDVLQREFPTLRVQLLDGAPSGPRIYDSHPVDSGHRPLFSQSVDVPLAGRSWTLVVSSLPGFERRIDRSAEAVILGAGFLIGALLFAITLSLTSTRERAVHLARRYTRELEDERRRLQEITATMGEGIYVQDGRGRITFVNPAAEHLLGWKQEELLGTPSHRLFTSQNGIGSHRHALERARQATNGTRFAAEQAEFRRRDGSLLPVSVVSTPILRAGKATGSVVAFQDLRERKAVEEALRASEQFRALFEYASEAMFLLDLAGRVVDVNRLACESLGYTREELIGLHPTRFVRWSTLPAVPFEQLFERMHAEPMLVEGEHVRKDGSTFAAEASFSAITHAGQRRILVAARDITQRKETEQRIAQALSAVERSRAEVEDINRRLAESNRELQRLSRRDGLTGIANRRHFDEYLQLEWRRAERDGRPLALLIADVDHFKAYNDVYGHQAGDESLRRVAQAIDAQLSRSIDVAARYGGEEFAVILPETPLAGALNIAERMRGAVMGLRIRHEASNVSEFVTVSIGAASIIPQRGESPDRLVGAADQALYDAKQGGRNRVCPPHP